MRRYMYIVYILYTLGVVRPTAVNDEDEARWTAAVRKYTHINIIKYAHALRNI